MEKALGWFFPAVLALLLWGLWGFFQKLATNEMASRNVYLFSALGGFSVVLFVLVTSPFPLRLTVGGTFLAVLGGVCSSLGALMFVKALSRGEASIVITLTALYPVVTIALSFAFLKEAITLKQGIGIVMALISMVLLT